MAHSLLSWFPVVFYICNIYRMTGNSALPYLAITYIAGLIGIGCMFFSRIRKYVLLLFFIIIYLVAGVINWAIVGNQSIQDIGQSVLLYGITVMLFVYPYTYAQGIIGFYLIMAAFIHAYLIGINTHYVLTSSGNYISVLMVLAAAVYYIGVENEGRKLKAWDGLPALICFLLSIWAKGRGGILSCGVLLLLVILVFVKGITEKNLKRILIALAIAVAIGVYFIVVNIDVVDSFMSLGKWNTRGTDNTIRRLLWYSYYSKVKGSLTYILLGAPLKDIPIVYTYNYNLHNSFLQLHAYNGIVCFAGFCFLMIKAMVYYVKKNRLLMCALVITLLIRGMSDKFIFGQYGMPVMLYLVLYPYAGEYVQNRKGKVRLKVKVLRFH